MRYMLWYVGWLLALLIEAPAVRLRDLCQRKKMECIRGVPGERRSW